MTNYNQTLRSVCEELGWAIYEEKETVELSQYSPAGEDFSFCVEKKNFVKNIENYMADFDADEHAAELIANRGKYGIPLGVRVLIDDADDIQEMLNKLWVSLDETKQNKYEELFDEFMDLVEFTLIKHKTETKDAIWSVYDRQGANLGDIDGDRFKNASEIFERMDIYIHDYIDEDLENVWIDELGHSFDDAPNTIEGWLDHKEELKEYRFELALIDMICHHANEINLENCYYEEEE